MSAKTNGKRIRLAELGIPQVVEATADGTGVGKTTGITRLRYHYERSGIKTTLVRIESRGVEHRPPLRAKDLFIPTESFAEAKRRVGGLAGVLAPAFARIAEAAHDNEAVLFDWAGGQVQNRLEIFAATGFDERLAERQVIGCSLIPTTNVVTRMREATKNLIDTARVAPGLRRILLLNERFGPFEFVSGGTAQAVHRDMLAAAHGSVIRFGEIGGDSWQICEDHDLTLPEVVRSKPAELADRIGQDAFIAKAVITELAAWWTASAQELVREFPLPAPTKA